MYHFWFIYLQLDWKEYIKKYLEGSFTQNRLPKIAEFAWNCKPKWTHEMIPKETKEL